MDKTNHTTEMDNKQYIYEIIQTKLKYPIIEQNRTKQNTIYAVPI